MWRVVNTGGEAASDGQLRGDPRKAQDTSIGDAVNWEWIIYCAQNGGENHNILVVSRDSDYGINYSGDTILNDWLRREFKASVSRKRKIELTNRLTDALKILAEQVTEEDIEQENKIIEFERMISEFVTSQKHSFRQSPQFVPWALVSDSANKPDFLSDPLFEKTDWCSLIESECRAAFLGCAQI